MAYCDTVGIDLGTTRFLGLSGCMCVHVCMRVCAHGCVCVRVLEHSFISSVVFVWHLAIQV